MTTKHNFPQLNDNVKRMDGNETMNKECGRHVNNFTISTWYKVKNYSQNIKD